MVEWVNAGESWKQGARTRRAISTSPNNWRGKVRLPLTRRVVFQSLRLGERLSSPRRYWFESSPIIERRVKSSPAPPLHVRPVFVVLYLPAGREERPLRALFVSTSLTRDCMHCLEPLHSSKDPEAPV